MINFKAEIILLDGLICVYRLSGDLFFYVIGGANENESTLRDVLDYISDSILNDNRFVFSMLIQK